MYITLYYNIYIIFILHYSNYTIIQINKQHITNALGLMLIKKESLTSVSASEVVIGDVADEFMPPCQRVHPMTNGLHGGRNSNRGCSLTSQPPRPLGHSASSF